GGKPGFIKVLDERHLIIPDIHGNRLFQSYANIDDNPHVGLIFMIPGWDYTARVNGTVRFVNKDELSQMGVDGEVFNPDEKAKTLQGLVLEVDEAYGHCPRALSFSKLWDSEQIEANRNVKPVGSPYK
ncbi:MAG: pyridoxamine 5'-phosphate oxidase family protein, partial [Chloroflexota bacterium]